MADKRKKTSDLLVVAFDTLAEVGWRRLSFAEVARRADAPLAEVHRRWSGRGALLRDLNRGIDEAMLDFDPVELAGLPARDRVFELLMRRLEALVPYRAGLARLARDARREPCLLLATACRLERSLIWLQDAAGLGRHGLRARLARRALAAAYLQTVRVWLRDQASDLGATMAELDKQLRRVEAIAGLAEARPPRSSSAAAPEPTAAPA
jgi:AcrR family transcriptional regulator